MKRIDVALVIGLLCSILMGSFSGFAQDCDTVRHAVVRLHILANSDSEADQQLKLAVRDAVLEQTGAAFAAAEDKAQAEDIVLQQLERIETVAREEIRRQGYAYDVQAKLINRYVETRTYTGFILPAGQYDAVQIEIGEAQGHNWWCVMYPPMCIPAASEQETTDAERQIRALSGTGKYTPAFALVEAMEMLRKKVEVIFPPDADKIAEK